MGRSLRSAGYRREILRAGCYAANSFNARRSRAGRSWPSQCWLGNCLAITGLTIAEKAVALGAHDRSPAREWAPLALSSPGFPCRYLPLEGLVLSPGAVQRPPVPGLYTGVAAPCWAAPKTRWSRTWLSWFPWLPSHPSASLFRAVPVGRDPSRRWRGPLGLADLRCDGSGGLAGLPSPGQRQPHRLALNLCLSVPLP